MKGVGTVIAMGVVYWIAYFMAIGIAIAIIGMLLLAIAAVVLFVVYLVGAAESYDKGDVDAAWVMLLTPGLMVGVALVATLLWKIGAPSFYADVVKHFEYGNHFYDGVVMVPTVLIAYFGWIVPLKMAFGYMGESPGRRLELPYHRTIIYSLASLWGIVGGSTFLITR